MEFFRPTASTLKILMTSSGLTGILFFQFCQLWVLNWWLNLIIKCETIMLILPVAFWQGLTFDLFVSALNVKKRKYYQMYHIHSNKCPGRLDKSFQVRIVIFPGKYAYFPDGGKYWEIPGNTGKYREIWEIPGNIKVSTIKC